MNASVLDCATGTNALVVINGCTCEGYDQIYECRITGSGSSYSLERICIRLSCYRHSSFIVVLTPKKTCNDGAISGRIIRAENNTYVSQLTVSFSAEMIGLTISCFHDSRGTQNQIGSSLIALTRGITSFY